MAIFLLVLGLLMFVGLVVLHEYGHFIMAKRGGVDVEEFGVGFPPKAKTLKKHKGTEYTLNWLPLGGFVRLKGENDADTRPHSYGAAKLSTKVKIMIAGVVMNLLAAFVLLTIVAWAGMPQVIPDQYTVKSDTIIARDDLVVVGEDEKSWLSGAQLSPGDVIDKINDQPVTDPQDMENILSNENSEKITFTIDDGDNTVTREIANPKGLEVAKVVEGSPADKLGLGPGSKIKSVSNLEIYTNQKLFEITKENKGQEVEISYINKNGEEVTSKVELNTQSESEEKQPDGSSSGYLGVGTYSPLLGNFKTQRSTWSAPVVAGGLIVQITSETLQGLGKAVSSLFSGDTKGASEQVAGPLGIFFILRDSSLLGYQFVLFIIALISLTLAIMNVLPIPALDGGRLFVTLLFRLFNKPLTKRAENLIHGTGFAMLMLLFVLITIVDVRRFF